MLASFRRRIYPILALKLTRNSVISNQLSAISRTVFGVPMAENELIFKLKTEETTMRDFREIKVWAKAHLLTLEAYKVTAPFPSRRDLRPYEPTETFVSFHPKRTSPRVLVEVVTQSLGAFFRSEWDLRARSSIISY
jgi:hypothetical protein